MACSCRRPVASLVMVVLAIALLPTSDAGASTGITEWTRQFGPTDADTVGVAVAADGSVYVVGQAKEQLGTEPLFGEDDAFIRKYGPTGAVVWTRLFGTAGEWTYGHDVAIAPDGSIYVVGETTGELEEGEGIGSDDAYVRKYDAAGNHAWTRQFGTASADRALAVAVAGDGSVFIAGKAAQNAFLARYDGAGDQKWFETFGTGGSDIAYGVAVAPGGSVYVAGATTGTFPGETNLGNQDAFLSKFDTAGDSPVLQWTRQFGSTAVDTAWAVVVTSTGIYVAGSAFGGLPGQTHFGQSDAFLRRYNASGNHQWTRQFGTAGFDFAYGAAPAPDGGVYVVGSTRDALVGGGHLGQDDAFTRRYTPNGHVEWTRQFGTAGDDAARAAAAGPSNTLVVAGSTTGDLVAGTFTGPNDFFVRKYEPPPDHPFTDIVGHEFEDAMAWLWDRKITIGCSPTTYCPDRLLTREEMATFIRRIVGLSPTDDNGPFVDHLTSEHRRNINSIRIAGITVGCSATAYCPKRTLTRAEIATLIRRSATPNMPSGGSAPFSDLADHWGLPAITATANANVAWACDGGTLFCPDKHVDRAEMAQWIYRAWQEGYLPKVP